MANRGVEISPGAWIGLGWMDGSAKVEDPRGLVDVLGEAFGTDTRDAPRTAFYDAGESFDYGRAHVFWGGRAMARETCRVEVEQTALDGLGFAGGVALARGLAREGWRPSRADIWLDDTESRITPAKVRAAVLGGQTVTHARPGRWVYNDEDGSSTYYLGAPSSDRRTRTYDYRGYTRHELQTRRSSARAAMSAVLNADDPARAALGNLVSFADFRDSRKYDHRTMERVPRVDWWAALVGDVAKVEGAPSRPKLSLEEMALYVMGHWARTLAELERDLGHDFIEQLMRKGRAGLVENEQERAA